MRSRGCLLCMFQRTKLAGTKMSSRDCPQYMFYISSSADLKWGAEAAHCIYSKLSVSKRRNRGCPLCMFDISSSMDLKWGAEAKAAHCACSIAITSALGEKWEAPCCIFLKWGAKATRCAYSIIEELRLPIVRIQEVRYWGCPLCKSHKSNIWYGSKRKSNGCSLCTFYRWRTEAGTLKKWQLRLPTVHVPLQ